MVRSSDFTEVPETEIRTFIRAELARLCEGVVQPDDIRNDFPLFDVEGDGASNFGLDSLDALELAMAIEEKYGVAVPKDVDFKELATINDIVAYVMRLVEQRGDGDG